MSQLVRLAVSIAAGLAAAVAVAIIVAIVDLYLTGHGRGSITREVIGVAPIGVHLSIGDVAMLIVAATVAAVMWFRTGRPG